MCLYNLHCPLLSEVKEADRTITTTKGSKMRLVRVTVHATKTNILTCAAQVCVCERERERERERENV